MGLNIDNIDFTKERRVLRGPYTLFEGSVICEFLDPEDVDATFLMRVTFPAKHPLHKLGEKHPIVPPLHLHFEESELFKCVKGKWGMTSGWEQKKTILTPDSDIFNVTPWLPHKPWPVACEEESVVYALGRPKGVKHPIDNVFFEHIFLHISDKYESKRMPDLFQLTLLSYDTASVNIMLPSWTFLGPLRWWIPHKVDGAIAGIAAWLGYTKELPAERKKIN